MKIFCFIGNSPKLSRAVQEEVFAAGGYWCTGPNDKKSEDYVIERYRDGACLGYDESGLQFSDKEYYENDDFEQLDIPEFLNRIKELHKPKQLKVGDLTYTIGESFVHLNRQEGFGISKQSILDMARFINELENK